MTATIAMAIGIAPPNVKWLWFRMLIAIAVAMGVGADGKLIAATETMAIAATPHVDT